MKELSISKLPNESHRFATTFQENPQFDQLKAKWIYRGSQSVNSTANLKKRLHRLAEIAYYQAGKIVVQTFLPLHPPVALITLDYSGITTSTCADTHINTNNELNNSWSSFLEARLIGLYGGKASSLLINQQHLLSCGKPEKKSETSFLASDLCATLCCTIDAIITTKSCTDCKQDCKEDGCASSMQKHSWSKPKTFGCNDFKRKDKINFFQSNIGIQEIKTATSLATIIVNHWVFSDLSTTTSIKNQHQKRYTFSPMQQLQQKVAIVTQENTETKLHNQFSKNDNKPFQQIQSSVEGVYYTKSMESIGTKFINRFSLGKFSDNVVFDSLCQWRGKWEEVVNYLEITLKSSLTPMTCFSKRVDFSPFLCYTRPWIAQGAQLCYTLPVEKEEIVEIPTLGDKDNQEKIKKKPKVTCFPKSATSFFCLLNSVNYSITLFDKVDAHFFSPSNPLIKKESQITAPEKVVIVSQQARKKKISYSFFVYICQSYLQSKDFVSKYSEELYYSSLQNDKPLRSLQLYVRYLEEKKSKLTTNYQSQRIIPPLCNISLDEYPSVLSIINKNRPLKKWWNTFSSNDSLLSVQLLQPFFHSYHPQRRAQVRNTKSTKSDVVVRSPLDFSPPLQPIQVKVVTIVYTESMISSFTNGVGVASALQFSIVPQNEKVVSNAYDKEKHVKMYTENVVTNPLQVIPYVVEQLLQCISEKENQVVKSEISKRPRSDYSAIGINNNFGLSLPQKMQDLIINKLPSHFLPMSTALIPFDPLSHLYKGAKKYSSFSCNRVSVEIVEMKNSSAYSFSFKNQIAHTFQLVNPLYFSVGQRNRFYPDWFRLYLPDMEATEFMKHISNHYLNLELQTLVRPSLHEFTFMFLDVCEIDSMLSTTFFPLISLGGHSLEYGHTGSFLRSLKFSVPIPQAKQNKNLLFALKEKNIMQTQKESLINNAENIHQLLDFKIKPTKLIKVAFCGIFENSLFATTPCLLKPVEKLTESHSKDFFNYASKTVIFGEKEQRWEKKSLKYVETQASCNLRQFQKHFVEDENLQTNTSFKSISDTEQTNIILTTSTENLFFSCGNNTLSIGIGILRNAAKRRNLLNIKNRSLPQRTPKKIVYPDVSVIFWGFSKPWDINRLINISIRQETSQQNMMQLHRLIKEKNCTLSLSNKDFLIAKINKEKNKSFPPLGLYYILEKCNGLVTHPIYTTRNYTGCNKITHGESNDCNKYAQNTPRLLQSTHSKYSNMRTVIVTQLFRSINLTEMQNQRFHSQNHSKNSNDLIIHKSIRLIDSHKSKKRKNTVSVESPDALSLQSAQIVHQPTLQRELVQNKTKSKEKIKQFDYIRHQYNRGLLHDKFMNLINNKENQLDTSFYLSLEKQIFPSNHSDAAIVKKELIYDSLISNCFSKAFFLINQNRQLTDYFADYLIRFKVLRQHQILYIFSTVLFSCKKQT